MRVSRGGKPIEGGWRRKSLELLAYLAAHPHGATRDQVLEALWPGGNPMKTQGYLWHAASHLRQRLRGPEESARIIEKVDDLYQLDLARVWADACVRGCDPSVRER